MTLLLLFNTPAATSSASGTAFQSFVEAGMFLGNWDIDDYLTFTACTHDDTGAAADADAVPGYAIYEDETATAIVSGNMTRLGAVTGFYTERVQLTAAAGFEAGKMYAIRVEAVMGGVMAAAAHSFAVKVASANVTYWAGVAAGAAPATVADLPAAAPSAATVADAVWDEVISGHLTSGTTGARLNTAASASGSGSTAYSNTVTDSASAPLDGVEVWITSDSGGAATVASTTTDTLGAFTVWLDPGTYYLWLAKGGYNFPNPTTITVS